jgi:thiosulfate/3-mercaptopyruvate sulfurtransferase
MSDYAHPEVLVSTDWVEQNIGSPKIKLVEVDVDTKAYDAGHIEGAIGFNWQTQLQDQVSRDILSKEALEDLLGNHGISNPDTIVLYGDNNNWFAAYAFWLLKVYGHRQVLLMDGGRVKWLNESERKLTVEPPRITPTRYSAAEPDLTLRVRVQDVLQAVRSASHNLVDVRSPDEFSGKILAPPGLSETAQRAGHIPGARSVPWSTAVRPDGTFKSAEELRKIYFENAGVDRTRPTIAYCRIGERSSHTWFALKYLLGLNDVRNYDGSWTEYGSMIGLPIERMEPEPARAAG